MYGAAIEMNKFKVITMILSVFLLLTVTVSCGTFENIETDSSSVSEVSDYSSEDIASSDESKWWSEQEPSTDMSEESADTVVSFLACPDNIIHPSVFYDAIERAARNNNKEPDFSDLHNADYDFSPIYKNVRDAMISADITYINQETLIGGTSGKIIGYPCFNSPSAVADEVIGLGVDVVNVAHNHMLDSGDTRYLENCNSVFEGAGIDVIGYYPDKESVNNITVIEREGIKIAFLAYTYATNGIKLPSKSSFVIPYFDKTLVTEQIAYAKQCADVIIVSCHWGYEDTFGVNSEQKEYAKLMCELGVDVVLGMHPHVIQPMEWMTSESGSETLVVYSLGNFVSGMVAGKNMLAGMLSLNIVRDHETGEIYIDEPIFIPIVTHYTKGSRVASNDTGYRDFEICYLSEYSAEMANSHGVVSYERSHGKTLVGGAFSNESLIATLKKYIPEEFLPNEFKS